VITAASPRPPDLTLPDTNQSPPLKSLHPDSSLLQLKLTGMEQKSTEELVRSLMPGQEDCLKTRQDGTVLDGHHRLYILRKRSVNVNALPREIVERED
jgi:hypothetical protein